MISFIKGHLDTVNSGSVIIDCGGVGYEIFVGLNTLSKLPAIGSDFKIHTYMQTREDGQTLYGFLSKEELSMFHLLICVSGIGPKGAMNILGTASAHDVMLAIISGDVKAMSAFPGIGKKIAARIILELKDKIRSETVTSYDFSAKETAFISDENNPKSEAVAALTALGYSRSEALKSIVGIYEDGMSTEQIIKLALKSFSR